MSDKINISFIKYNTLFWLQSDQDPWKRLIAKETLSEQNDLTKNQRLFNWGGLIVTFSAKSEIQTVFCILPDEKKIFKKSTIQKVLKKLILHIINSQKLLTNYWKKVFYKKNGNVTLFSAKIDLSICPSTCEFFQIFFLIFGNPVCRKMFESYLRIVCIDYPELKKKLKKFICFRTKKVRILFFSLNNFFSLIC